MIAWSIANGSILDVLPDFRENSFDAILCDPPYGLEFQNHKWDYDVPSVDIWRECLRVLKPGAPIVAFGGSRTYHRLACGIEDAGFLPEDQIAWLYAQGKPPKKRLKPAHENILVARKPGQALELDVESCRIGVVGRWPPNVAVCEDVAGDLDETYGEHKSTPFRENVVAGSVLPFTRRTAGGYSDTGGVSRYFFCAKASSNERDAGLNGRSNPHPCVKPLKLTQWLAALIKRENAIVLVPFAGSGSEMIGCLQAGWSGVFGIEREAEYVEIARARIGHWCPEAQAA